MDEREKARGPVAPERTLQSDRRDSLRVPIRFLVRETALGGSFEERSGNLSLGGVFFTEPHPPYGSHVEIRLLLPGLKQDLRVAGEILRVSREGGAFGAHVRFQDLPLESELAIARFLERAEGA
jgi:uncharacterized protein (TIGR02266 family)